MLDGVCSASCSMLGQSFGSQGVLPFFKKDKAELTTGLQKRKKFDLKQFGDLNYFYYQVSRLRWHSVDSCRHKDNPCIVFMDERHLGYN